MKSLLRSKLSLLSASFLFASLGSPALGLAWSLVPEPVEGILVLENGNILRGKVQQLGEHYHVHLPNGKLQVRAKQVEMFCHNLEEAYQRRREARAGSTADSHLGLAAWCLRHDLFSHAEAELLAAQAIDSDHRRLALLQRQLKQSRQMAVRKIQQQHAEQNVVPEPPPLDPAALEKAPQWARALFVRQIQPLIVHSCAAGGCHQSSTGEAFQLNRLATEGAGHPEATLRNLAATLEQIDWQAADQSDLLRRAQQAHGSLSASAPLPPHKFQVLQSWVDQLSEAHHKEMQLETLPPVTEIAALPADSRLILNAPQQLVPQPSSQVQQASYEPVDPFDPAAFNERSAAAAKLHAEPTVPHVLVPDESTSIPASAAE